MDESPLKALVEEQLGSVVFVMDYIQLDFSSARFTAYVWPTVTLGDVQLPASFVMPVATRGPSAEATTEISSP